MYCAIHGLLPHGYAVTAYILALVTAMLLWLALSICSSRPIIAKQFILHVPFDLHHQAS